MEKRDKRSKAKKWVHLSFTPGSLVSVIDLVRSASGSEQDDNRGESRRLVLMIETRAYYHLEKLKKGPKLLHRKSRSERGKV